MTFKMACYMLESYDQGTWEHSKRVAHSARLCAEKIGMSKQEAIVIEHGALLHDIGKIGIPEELVNKKGPMTPIERDYMENHTTYGVQLIESLENTKKEYIDIAADHHAYAQSNGGYRAAGRSAHNPPSVPAKIVALSDTYDALTSERAYKKPLSKEKAIQIMEKKMEEGQFDPKIYKVFKEKVIPILEAEKAMERQGIHYNSMPEAGEMHAITEQQWEDMLGVDLGKTGIRSDVRDRNMSAAEEDRMEKLHNADLSHNGKVDEPPRRAKREEEEICI